MTASRDKSKGFTLVELLAATVLSALLTVAFISVVGSVARDGRALARTDQSRVPNGVIDLLRRDLANSRVVTSGEDGVRLIGYGWLESPGEGGLRHLPVELTYEVQKVGQRRWLLRSQRRLDRPDTRTTELVCTGVRAVELVVVTERMSGPNATGIATPPEAGIRLSLGDGEAAVHEEVVVMR